MDGQQNSGEARRRKRTKMEIFKEEKLPLLIAGAAAILILVFVIGSICMAVEKNKAEKRLQAQEAAAREEYATLSARQEEIAAQADDLMAGYYYEEALKLLESFEGDLSVYTEVGSRIETCKQAMETLVAWSDPGQVVNLSFQMLVADTDRAFSYPNWGNSINRNFITTGEFRAILEELYANGYVLVNREDILQTQTGEDGTVTYSPGVLYLPEGKKPLMLTQTNVNYNLYLVDRESVAPDKDGGGFACRLAVDDSGNFYSEMVDATGALVSGEYDLVPILESFISAHPDFSYQDARATLALTGYNGLFGYRTNASAKQGQDEASFAQEQQSAKTVADALRATGYELAFYTYENMAYGQSAYEDVKRDLQQWLNETGSILGTVETIVFAQNSDIGTKGAYSGDKFILLQQAGFRHYVGFCDDGVSWASCYGSYSRQGRILVTGANLKNRAQWFAGLFDAASVLDMDSRGSIPQQ